MAARVSIGPALAEAAATVAALPRDARILLVCHVNPDGDALGSMLGFGLGLRRMGFTQVVATFPEPFEVVEPFRFMPGLDLLAPPSAAAAAPAALGASFDAASTPRLGELAPALAAAPAWLVLDHHASNPGFGTHQLIDPAAAATAVVSAQLLDQLEVAYDEQIATCLYVGLATDTGSFKFDATTAQTHQLAARLLAAGVRPAEVSRSLFDTRPFAAMQLLGVVLSRAERDQSVAGGLGLVVAYATQSDLDQFGQPAHVLESFIDVVRSASETDIACMVKPASNGDWSVSLRSKGATDVARVAMALGGGGHRLAAGFTGRGELADVIAAVRAQLG
jgi:phosphoesterase RecJ-like protein